MQVAVHSLPHHRLVAVAHLRVDGTDAVGVLGQLRNDAHRGVQALVHGCGQPAVPVRVGRLRRQHPGHVGVHRRRRGTQPLALTGEVAAHLVGVQIALVVEVAHARGGQAPAVAAVRHEPLEHEDRGRRGAGVPVVVDLGVAQQCGDVRVPGRPQRGVDLDVRVEPGLHAAEELHDRLLAVDQRGVALLGGDDVTGQTRGDLRPLGRDEAQRPHRRGLDQVVQPRSSGVPVPHGVVGVALPVGVRHGPDQGRRQFLDGMLVPRHRHEVGVGAAVGVLDRHPVDRQDRVRLVEEETLLADVGPVAALAPEPALLRHPLAEQLGQGVHRVPPVSSAVAAPESSPVPTRPAASRESATAVSSSSVSPPRGSGGLASSNQ